MRQRVAILGLGLIGGSIGLALTQSRFAAKVTGYDMEASTRGLALQNGAVDEVFASPEEAVQEADLVIMAVPVRQIVPLAGRIMPFLLPGAVLSDVGSTKSEIVREMESMLPDGVYFVGGHPMAGSERGGIAAADRYLLENAFYIITPTARTNPGALKELRSLIEAVGARPVELDPQKHDVIVATVSHLPHLVAAVLVNVAGATNGDSKQVLGLAAGGFRDTTRIASGDPNLWLDILLSNKNYVLEALDRFQQALAETARAIAGANEDAITGFLGQAQQLRREIPARTKGFLPVMHELVVTVPDRPGMIAEISRVLGDNQVNIIDIEILRLREGEGGSIRLAFRDEVEAEMAVSLLMRHGLKAKRR